LKRTERGISFPGQTGEGDKTPERIITRGRQGNGFRKPLKKAGGKNRQGKRNFESKNGIQGGRGGIGEYLAGKEGKMGEVGGITTGKKAMKLLG